MRLPCYELAAKADLENREPIVNGHEGRKSFEVVCALHRAAEESHLIRL